MRNYVSNILAKLQVNDRTMAVIYAIQRGWIKMGYDGGGPPPLPESETQVRGK